MLKSGPIPHWSAFYVKTAVIFMGQTVCRSPRSQKGQATRKPSKSTTWPVVRSRIWGMLSGFRRVAHRNQRIFFVLPLFFPCFSCKCRIHCIMEEGFGKIPDHSFFFSSTILSFSSKPLIKTSTKSGSNWVPAQRLSSLTASLLSRAFR